MAETERFSTVLKDFNKVLEEHGEELGPARAAFQKGTKKGKPVEFGQVIEALPKELRAEGRQVERAISKESGYRGDKWTSESLATELATYLPALADGETEDAAAADGEPDQADEESEPDGEAPAKTKPAKGHGHKHGKR